MSLDLQFPKNLEDIVNAKKKDKFHKMNDEDTLIFLLF